MRLHIVLIPQNTTNSKAFWTQTRREGYRRADCPSTGPRDAPPQPHKLTPEPATILISEMDFTPRQNKDAFVTRKEGATVARTFWVLFIQISVCGEEEERVGVGGGEQEASHSGAALRVDALRAEPEQPQTPRCSLTGSLCKYLLSAYNLPATPGSTSRLSPHGIHPHSLIKEVTPALTPFYR